MAPSWRRCYVIERSCSKHDKYNLEIVVRYCEDIGHLIKLHGSDEEDFRENISLQYSCVFALEQIGEHVKQLSSELIIAHPEFDWRGPAGMRDKLAHAYDYIDLSWVRSTVLDDVPILEKVCRDILSGS